jgi:PKD domain
VADTHGFDVLVEAGESVLVKVLQGAWKSAECPEDPGNEGRIPEYRDIPPGTALDSYVVADGQVQIPREELDATMAPDVNGVQIKLGLRIQVEIESPPVPSAGFLEMAADIRAKVPIGTLPASKNVGMLLDGLPRASVSCTLTSGDPLAPKLAKLIAEYAHRAYENWTPTGPIDPALPAIPHFQDTKGVTWNLGFGGASITVDTHTELYDDETDPAHRIEVTLPAPGRLRVTIPMYLRIFNIRKAGAATYLDLRDPMGVETRLIIDADLESPPGSYTVRFDTATVTSGSISPAPGTEGSNYTHNRDVIPVISLDSLLQGEIASRGTTTIHALGAGTVAVPTVAEITQAIGDLFHTELEARSFVSIWTPEASGASFTATDVTTRALSDALVIALNAGAGADIGSVTNLIPAGREFAVAIDAATVQASIDRARQDNGFADSDLPKRMRQDDKDVDLNSLDVFLTDGSIRMTGEVTVIDAVLGSIDVDADFRVDVGLHWEPSGALNADGVQTMGHDIIGEPEVDPEESVAFWIIAIILAVISFGAGSVLIAIIIIVVALVVTAIAEGVGGQKLVDGVTGAVSGITGWPPELSRIGTVTAVFSDPIEIATTGFLMSGTLEVVSSCEATQVLAADSGGPYSVAAASPLALQAQHSSAVASYSWLPGDRTAAVAMQDITHVYDSSGLYVAKHALTINQPGGATSRHFALVEVDNVPPTVDAGPDITVNEGELATLVGHFDDVEHADTHESMWNFGDAQAPESGTVQETNDPPRATGTSTVAHAWCDNGDYQVTLQVRDQNGGVGTDTRTVHVQNVTPTVDAGRHLFAYPCTVITLTGEFTDPGWCDTHEGTWDFGDCTPVTRAIIRETHEAPEGTGVAIASHVYERCGTYLATCTVVDDDGGIGRDTTVVRVVDVQNRDFEGGFRPRLPGIVASAWEPYRAVSGEPAVPDEETESTFYANQEVVHSGQRSQGVRTTGGSPAGIYQRVGANSGWDYQVTAWYALDERRGGVARLGLDPTGGTDPGGATVVWDQGSEHQQWAVLITRATATASAVTLFVELVPEAATPPGADIAVGSTGRPVHGYFDDLALVAVQPFCPSEKPERPPRGPSEGRTTCTDFSREGEQASYPPHFDYEGFRFQMLDGQPARIVTYGPPLGVSKLELRTGVLVDLPFAAEWVTARVSRGAAGFLSLIGVCSSGNVVARYDAPPASNVETELAIESEDVVRVQVSAKGSEGGLIEICAGAGQG